MATNIKNRYKPVTTTRLKRPLFLSRVPAGTFSPADDYIEKGLDLNEHLIKHEAATFFCRISGDSMKGAGIFSGDLAIVDRSLKAVSGSIVVVNLNGETNCKRLKMVKGKVYLYPENPDFKPMEVPEGADFEIWGVVTNVIHKVAKS